MVIFPKSSSDLCSMIIRSGSMATTEPLSSPIFVPISTTYPLPEASSTNGSFLILGRYNCSKLQLPQIKLLQWRSRPFRLFRFYNYIFGLFLCVLFIQEAQRDRLCLLDCRASVCWPHCRQQRAMVLSPPERWLYL